MDCLLLGLSHFPIQDPCGLTYIPWINTKRIFFAGSRGNVEIFRLDSSCAARPPARQPPLHVTGLSRPAYSGRLMNTDKLAGCRPALSFMLLCRSPVDPPHLPRTLRAPFVAAAYKCSGAVCSDAPL